MAYYTTKIMKVGDVYEVFSYEKPVFYGNSVRSICKTGGKVVKGIEKIVYNRAKYRLKRLITCNVNKYQKKGFRPFKPVFLTLTFKDNVVDRQVAIREFRLFIKRLNFRLYGRNCSNFKYIAVPEFQKRGAFHFHFVCFNLPYIKKDDMADIWQNGFVDMKIIKDLTLLSTYVTKYLTKELASDNVKSGIKNYFCSIGLFRPFISYFQKSLADLVAYFVDYELTFTKDFSTKLNGLCQYNLFVPI